MREKKDKPFNNPFFEQGKALKKQLKAAQKEAAKPKVAPKPKPEPQIEPDEQLFASAIAGAKPLHDDPRGVIKPPLPPGDANHISPYDEDAEAYAELVDLVEGRRRFDISDSDEFIEGVIEGLDRRILGRLKRGEFSFREHLDLHGMTRDEARDAVDKFITEARKGTQRAVLIVHGRGQHSKDNIPVLKGLLKNWLERGRIARAVLAFCTARPHDGGAGAMYVLLRR